MIELIRYDDNKWNEIVKSFKKYDIYFLREYSESFMFNDDGTPYLLHYVNGSYQLCYPVIEKDIANFPAFKGQLEKGKYFDWQTPYGYGGPLADENMPLDLQKDFSNELFNLAKDRNVVTQFVRFHPVLFNHEVCNNVIETTYLKDTIFIDLSTNDDLMAQMDSKNRNLIRKAQKNDVVVFHDKGEYLNEFIQIYEETMDRDNARDFYYFKKDYYKYLISNLQNETEFFYAKKDGKIIASSIFFYGNGQMHYHLSGNLVEYRTYAPTNLLLYEAGNWGRTIGMKTLHLGGGVGIDDSLFHFKKQFNKEGRIGFYLGRNIFDKEKYNYLLKKRVEIDSLFDMNNDFYIQYRKY